jgi:hypothetical protein
VSNVIATFGGCEEGERGRDKCRDVIKRPRSCGAEKRFQFRKRLFDGIEVGTVRGQKAERRPHGRNRGADLRLSVDGKIVEDDDVARLQGRHEHLLDVGQEATAVDRAVKHRRRRQAVRSQRGDDGVRLPVTVRGVIVEADAPQTAAISAEQIGRDAALIDEDPLANVAQWHPRAPVAALSRDVRSPLFVGVHRFF